LHELLLPIQDDEIQLCWVSDCIGSVIDKAVTFAQSVDLLQQQIVNDSYECVFLSAFAVILIKRYATYMPPNMTTLFAALIAIFQALILYLAQNYPINHDGLLENAALLTDQMMIHPDLSRRSGAMALIWHKFSYAKVISQNTMQPALCCWDNNVLVYCGNTHFSIVQFCLMLTHFIAEAKKLIANLLLLPNDHTRL
jgi:hypothetical protein